MESSYNKIFNSMDYKNVIGYIVDGMDDWVRVIDLEDRMIFVNDSMMKAFNTVLIGNKCYKAVGRDTPCENCTSRKVVLSGVPQLKEELLGDRTLSVMSSPIKNDKGEIIAVVEVLRDITEMKNLQKEILEQNKKLKRELNMARKLQYSLLPKAIFEDKFEFSYIYKPCEALGGDFLDIFKIDEHHTGVYIADVSGHGLAASMLTVFLSSSINKYTLSPAEALKQLFMDFNRDYSDQDMYITVFYAIIDTRNYSMVYSNAGHNVSPVLINKVDKFELLRVPGIPISNWVESPEYKDVAVSLEKHDKIFLYTDGVVELRNNDNEQFGEERLLNILMNVNSNPAVTLDLIIENVTKFACIQNLRAICDDITMILLEVK